MKSNYTALEFTHAKVQNKIEVQKNFLYLRNNLYKVKYD